MAILVDVDDLLHPVVFLCDPTEDVEIPDDVSAAPVCSTPTCLSILTQAYVDGPVRFEAIDSRECTGDGLPPLVEVYKGSVCAPSGTLSLGTAEDDDLLRLEVTSTKPSIQVLVDDRDNPARIVLLIGGLSGGAVTVRT